MKKCSSCNANMSHKGLCNCNPLNFKPGQLVKCILGTGEWPIIIVGSVYTIESVGPNGVSLMQFSGHPENLFFSHRFEALKVPDEAPRLEATVGGKKFDTEKVDIGLLSSVAVVEIAKVMTFGKKKYAAHNWRKGINYSRLLSAALRHIFAYLGGESKDPETGLSHLGHACCCLMFILEFEVTKPELDDRYSGGKNG